MLSAYGQLFVGLCYSRFSKRHRTLDQENSLYEYMMKIYVSILFIIYS
jgi:hypothetical protein